MLFDGFKQASLIDLPNHSFHQNIELGQNDTSGARGAHILIDQPYQTAKTISMLFACKTLQHS
jgi:hypothetical protein